MSVLNAFFFVRKNRELGIVAYVSVVNSSRVDIKIEVAIVFIKIRDPVCCMKRIGVLLLPLIRNVHLRFLYGLA